MRLLAFLTSALMMLFAIPAQAGEAIPVPGTSWSIEPPPGFVLRRDPTTMFVHPSKAVFMVMQGPVAPLALAELGAIGSIQGEGENVTRLDETRDLTVGGRHAIYFKGYMTQRNSTVYSLAIEGESSNGMVIAVVPANAEGAIDQAALDASLLTALEIRQTIEQRAEALPYRFDDLAGMRIGEIVVGSVAIITDGPSNDMASAPDQPFAMVFVGDSGGETYLDVERDGKQVRDRITKEYPDAAFLGTVARDTRRGRVLEVSYTRKDKDTQKTLAGIAWFRIDDRKVVLMIAQHPLSGYYYDRLATVRDGITLK